MTFLFEAPKMAFFDCGGVRLMLAVPEKPEYDHPSSIIYYKVADIQEAYDELASRGVRFEAPPGLVAKLEDREIWMAFLRDVDENLLAVTSETPTN
jgi:methylmalonyl-CoA/ethylmalonyl-CoA epimerase